MRTKCVLAGLLVVLFGIGEFLVAGSSLAAVGQKSSGTRGLKLLQEIEAGITELAARVSPAVVNISPVPTPGRPRERFRNPRGTGSGVIIDARGHIVTNHHVVGDDAEQVQVRYHDRTTVTGHVIGRDPDTDLAVIKVSASRKFPNARLGDSDEVKVGQWALAVGNPFGLDRTVTLGVVSGVGREDIKLSKYENFIQTDSSIFPGNSGGPLFNLRGEVIGINTAVMNSVQGIGFAIPSNMVKQVVTQLLERGKVVRGWLGVGIQHLTDDLGKQFGVKEGQGVLVNEVFEDDPAAVGGIRPGDIITKIDGKTVDTPNSLSRLIAGLGPGATTNIEIVRDRRRMVLAVSLTARKDKKPVVASLPSARPEIQLGLHIQDLNENLAEKFKLTGQRGALIAKVEQGSLAQIEGLQAGDLITEVNREDVGSAREFGRAMRNIRRSEPILLRILRESRAFYVVLRQGG